MQICLNYFDIIQISGVAVSHFYRWSQIDRPNLSAVFSRIIGEAAITTSRVQNFLSPKELGCVGFHIIEKLSPPFFIHFGKAVPLESKTERGLYLSGICISRFAI